MRDKKIYFEWINISRGIGIFLVVVGHACMCVGRLNQFLFQFIYSFHMPLFFFISGFCSLGILKLEQAKERLAYCKKRFLRLMVPYLSVGIIYVFLDKLMGITDLYSGGFRRLAIHFAQGDNPNWQLWTLYALFGCSVVCVLLAAYSIKLIIGVAVVFQIVYCTSLVGIGYCTILSSIEEHLIYFVAGLLVHEFYGYFKRFKEYKKTIWLFAFIALIGMNIFDFYFEIHRSVMLLSASLGIIIICLVAIELQYSNSFSRKIFNQIGYFGMDIYILANLPQVAIRTLLFEMFELNEWIVVIVSSVVGIVVPMLVSKYVVRKNRCLSILILGM